jgi:beta-lactamase regulating signal transducer with metallopeptidase domain
LWLAASLGFHQPSALSVQIPSELAPSAAIGELRIQTSWAYPISILLRILGTLYLLVLASFLFRRIRKHTQLQWVLQFSYRAPEAIEEIFQPIAENMARGSVRLLALAGIHSPATFGWIHPTVLLPPLCLELDESELADIFRHELQHIQRRDSVFHAIASLCRALLFFHPAVWYAMRRLELESELACDLAVVNGSPESRATYAECLVRFARLNVAQEPRPWNLDFAGSSVQLKVRIRCMLEDTQQIPGWLMGLRIALGLFLLAGFVGIAPSLVVSLSYEQERIASPAEEGRVASPSQIRLHKRGVIKAAAIQGQTLHGNGVSAALSTVSPPNVPAEAAADVTAVLPRGSERVISGQSEPTLKRRGDIGGGATQKTAQPKTILLQNEPSTTSADADARRASAISDITAGVSEAVSIASHGRDREGH